MKKLNNTDISDNQLATVDERSQLFCDRINVQIGEKAAIFFMSVCSDSFVSLWQYALSLYFEISYETSPSYWSFTLGSLLILKLLAAQLIILFIGNIPVNIPNRLANTDIFKRDLTTDQVIREQTIQQQWIGLLDLISTYSCVLLMPVLTILIDGFVPELAFRSTLLSLYQFIYMSHTVYLTSRARDAHQMLLQKVEQQIKSLGTNLLENNLMPFKQNMVIYYFSPLAFKQAIYIINPRINSNIRVEGEHVRLPLDVITTRIGDMLEEMGFTIIATDGIKYYVLVTVDDVELISVAPQSITASLLDVARQYKLAKTLKDFVIKKRLASMVTVTHSFTNGLTVIIVELKILDRSLRTKVEEAVSKTGFPSNVLISSDCPLLRINLAADVASGKKSVEFLSNLAGLIYTVTRAQIAPPKLDVPPSIQHSASTSSQTNQHESDSSDSDMQTDSGNPNNSFEPVRQWYFGSRESAILNRANITLSSGNIIPVGQCTQMQSNRYAFIDTNARDIQQLERDNSLLLTRFFRVHTSLSWKTPNSHHIKKMSAGEQQRNGIASDLPIWKLKARDNIELVGEEQKAMDDNHEPVSIIIFNQTCKH